MSKNPSFSAYFIPDAWNGSYLRQHFAASNPSIFFDAQNNLGGIYMQQEINIGQIRQDAEELYRTGGFFCSEAIVYSIKKNIAPEMPEALIAASSGFPVGVGGSKCMCGAVSGAVMCLGYFFGRTEPSNPATKKCMKLAKELQDSFRQNHNGVMCCHIHTKGFIDMATGAHKRQCTAFSGEMAAKAAEIIARELGLKVV